MDTLTDKLEAVLILFPLPSPGINPFDMTFAALARLHAGEPLTVAAYRTEVERVWSLLVARVDLVRQFSIERAEFALDAWEAWVQSEGSFTQATVLLKQKFGRTLSRQALYHHVKSMMVNGIIPHHRSRKPAGTHIGVKEINEITASKAASVSTTA